MKEYDIVLIEGNEYIEVDRINIEDNIYVYLTELSNPDNFIIRKYLEVDGEEYFEGLESNNEFDKVLTYFLKKHKSHHIILLALSQNSLFYERLISFFPFPNKKTRIQTKISKLEINNKKLICGNFCK